MVLSAVSFAIAGGLDLVITSSPEKSVSVAWQVLLLLFVLLVVVFVIVVVDVILVIVVVIFLLLILLNSVQPPPGTSVCGDHPCRGPLLHHLLLLGLPAGTTLTQVRGPGKQEPPSSPSPPALISICLQAANWVTVALGSYLVSIQDAIYSPDNRAVIFFFYCGLQVTSPVY